MPKPNLPLRAVVSTELGPRSQRFVMPDGSVAIVCGPPARADTLECGHVVTTWGGRAARRRCGECGEALVAAAKALAAEAQAAPRPCLAGCGLDAVAGDVYCEGCAGARDRSGWAEP